MNLRRFTVVASVVLLASLFLGSVANPNQSEPTSVPGTTLPLTTCVDPMDQGLCSEVDPAAMPPTYRLVDANGEYVVDSNGTPVTMQNPALQEPDSSPGEQCPPPPAYCANE